MVSPDLVHQVIKVALKDHLVAWTEKYLELGDGKMCATETLSETNCMYLVYFVTLSYNALFHSRSCER